MVHFPARFPGRFDDMATGLEVDYLQRDFAIYLEGSLKEVFPDQEPGTFVIYVQPATQSTRRVVPLV